MKFVVTRVSNWNDTPEPGLPVELVKQVGYAHREAGWVERSVIELDTMADLMSWIDGLSIDTDARGVVIWVGDCEYGYELPEIEIYDDRRES